MGHMNKKFSFGYTLIVVFVLFVAVLGIGLLYKKDYKEFYLLRINPLEDHQFNSDDLKKLLIESDIWMLGDSRVQMWNEELISELGSVANLGIDGQTSEQSLLRLKSYLEIDTPKILFVEVGINELKIIGVDQGLTNMILDNFYNNMKSIAEICHNNNITLILANVFPVGKIEIIRRPVWNKTVNQAIKEVNSTLEEYCNNNEIYYFDAYHILSDDGELVNSEYQKDFLHINVMGYEALSKNLKELINKIINP
jgi:lysophospholipase L1-like esterase